MSEPVLTDYNLRPGEEGYVQDPAKAEDMALAELPYQEDALALEGVIQNSLSRQDDLTAGRPAETGDPRPAFKHGQFSPKVLNRDARTNMEMAKDKILRLSRDAAEQAGKEYDQGNSPTTEVDDLDRPRLRELTQKALENGKYFGRDLELTDEDREQFKKIIDKVESALTPMYEDPDWKTFMKLIDEAVSKGVNLGVHWHKGTFVPAGILDGGEDPAVKKVLLGEEGQGGGIQVPHRLYNLYHWQQTVDKLRFYTDHSNEMLDGRSPKFLGQALKHLASFIKQANLQK